MCSARNDGDVGCIPKNTLPRLLSGHGDPRWPLSLTNTTPEPTIPCRTHRFTAVQTYISSPSGQNTGTTVTHTHCLKATPLRSSLATNTHIYIYLHLVNIIITHSQNIAPIISNIGIFLRMLNQYSETKYNPCMRTSLLRRWCKFTHIYEYSCIYSSFDRCFSVQGFSLSEPSIQVHQYMFCMVLSNARDYNERNDGTRDRPHKVIIVGQQQCDGTAHNQITACRNNNIVTTSGNWFYLQITTDIYNIYIYIYIYDNQWHWRSKYFAR